MVQHTWMYIVIQISAFYLAGITTVYNDEKKKEKDTEMSRAKFGNASKVFHNQDLGNINTIMRDDLLAGRFIISSTNHNGDSIFTIDITTQDVALIAGNPTIERIGANITFSKIRGIITSPIGYPHNLWVASEDCIQNVNRYVNKTTHFTGQCNKIGDFDGIVSEAETGTLNNILKDPSNDVFYIFDSDSMSLKSIQLDGELSSWTLTTVYFFEKEDAAEKIAHLTFDLLKTSIYISTTKTLVWRYSLATNQVDRFVYDGISGISDMVFLDQCLVVVVNKDGAIYNVDLSTTEYRYISHPRIISALYSLSGESVDGQLVIGANGSIYSLLYTSNVTQNIHKPCNISSLILQQTSTNFFAVRHSLTAVERAGSSAETVNIQSTESDEIAMARIKRSADQYSISDFTSGRSQPTTSFSSLFSESDMDRNYSEYTANYSASFDFESAEKLEITTSIPELTSARPLLTPSAHDLTVPVPQSTLAVFSITTPTPSFSAVAPEFSDSTDAVSNITVSAPQLTSSAPVLTASTPVLTVSIAVTPKLARSTLSLTNEVSNLTASTTKLMPSTSVLTDLAPVLTDLAPVLTTQPSRSTVQPPALTAQPPVLTAQPPVLTAQPPVPTTQPPVLTAQPPVLTAQPPVLTDQPPVPTTQPPVLTAQPPVLTAQPPVSTTQSPVLSAQPPVLTTQTPVLTTQATGLTSTTPTMTSPMLGLTNAPSVVSEAVSSMNSAPGDQTTILTETENPTTSELPSSTTAESDKIGAFGQKTGTLNGNVMTIAIISIIAVVAVGIAVAVAVRSRQHHAPSASNDSANDAKNTTISINVHNNAVEQPRQESSKLEQRRSAMSTALSARGSIHPSEHPSRMSMFSTHSKDSRQPDASPSPVMSIMSGMSGMPGTAPMAPVMSGMPPTQPLQPAMQPIPSGRAPPRIPSRPPSRLAKPRQPRPIRHARAPRGAVRRKA